MNKYGFITYQVNARGAVPEQKWEATLTDAYQNAKRVYSEIFEEGRKAGLTRTQQKVSQQTEIPATGPAQIYSGSDPKKLSVREALELAQKGIKVPQR